MEWRTEAKSKKEIIEYLKNQPDDFVWAAVLDANEKRDRIDPVIVGIFIFPYSHIAKDLCRRENFFIENRLKFKKVKENQEHYLKEVKE
ncbi:MAG: hypothetical protein ACW97P_12440 [Candidatus Hodarchaeales archaeon]|jgi:hypothetical protein